jgi:hypothetical protein
MAKGGVLLLVWSLALQGRERVRQRGEDVRGVVGYPSLPMDGLEKI